MFLSYHAHQSGLQFSCVNYFAFPVLFPRLYILRAPLNTSICAMLAHVYLKSASVRAARPHQFTFKLFQMASRKVKGTKTGVPKLTRNSEAVQLLLSKFESGLISKDADARSVWESEIIVKRHNLPNFRTCFNNMRKEFFPPAGKLQSNTCILCFLTLF